MLDFRLTSPNVCLSFLIVLLFSTIACEQKKPETPAAPAPVAPPAPPVLSDSTAPDSLAAYAKAHPHDTLVLISTPKGDIKIRLYHDTPLHRANFVRLADYGFFDKTVFFRVEKDFMIQGGRSDFQDMKIGVYRIPAEIKRHHFNKRGAVGMARYGDDQNPERMSSNRDFYIVQGHPYSDWELQSTIKEFNLHMTPEQKKVYRTQGGAPNLDEQYTVFGEVVEGIEVVDSIAAVTVDQQKWPVKDVGMKVKVIR